MTARVYLTTIQAAEYLGLSRNAFYTLLCRRRQAGRPITTYRLNGRLRFTASDLDAAMTVEQSRIRVKVSA